MTRASIAFAFAALTTTAIAGENFLVYFGTSTNAKNGSKGVYVSRFNTATGELTEPQLAVEAGNPGFLAIHPSKKYLYACGDVTKADGKKAGGISAFGIDSKSGKLTLINQAATAGAGPCHVSVDKTGKVATIANYGSGSISSYAIKEDGSVSPEVSFFQHEGSGADPKRQAGPHAHSVNFSPDNRFAFACDLGLDKVLIYKVDTASGKLTPNDPPFAKTPAGGGPRHLAFHPSGKFVFVNNEMGMSETVFAYDAEKGALTEVETVSTLPEADRGMKGLSTAESVAHPNGRVVYVSNRTHDTIAVFACDPATGKLTLLQNVPVEGKIPRNICLDPTGKWLIAAHQDSATAALFKVDQDSGKLTFTGTKVNVPGSICVRFLALD
ncbi:MAG: lactonase family protein [Prosthecobacter sp.]|uniref:lactonase family protein n=1 Tax=Prosthecobacter sp. TaxID=1965333 RepID=UPI003BAEFC43